MYYSTKIIELGSCAFRQPQAESHCKFLHGYRLTAKFWFESDHLDKNNWVVDFGGLKELKKFFQNQFDHTTCISSTDPKLDVFKKLNEAGVCDLRIMDGVGIEKFAEFCHGKANTFVDQATQGRCRCTQVEVYEHENNSAIYKTDRITPTVSDLEKWSTSGWSDDYKKGRTSDPVEKKSPINEDSLPSKQSPPVSKKPPEKLPPGQVPNQKAPTSVNPRQVKSTNTWVDPKHKGKSSNSWLF